MLIESLAMEHYRLHVIERWPESGKKTAALAGVRSAIESLLREESAGAEGWRCIACGENVQRGAHRRMLKAAA